MNDLWKRFSFLRNDIKQRKSYTVSENSPLSSVSSVSSVPVKIRKIKYRRFARNVLSPGRVRTYKLDAVKLLDSRIKGFLAKHFRIWRNNADLAYSHFPSNLLEKSIADFAPIVEVHEAEVSFNSRTDVPRITNISHISNIPHFTNIPDLPHNTHFTNATDILNIPKISTNADFLKIPSSLSFQAVPPFELYKSNNLHATSYKTSYNTSYKTSYETSYKTSYNLDVFHLSETLSRPLYRSFFYKLSSSRLSCPSPDPTNVFFYNQEKDLRCVLIEKWIHNFTNRLCRAFFRKCTTNNKYQDDLRNLRRERTKKGIQRLLRYFKGILAKSIRKWKGGSQRESKHRALPLVLRGVFKRHKRVCEERFLWKCAILIKY